MSFFVKCPEAFLGVVPAGPLLTWLSLRSLCHEKTRRFCETSSARIAEVANVPARTVRTHLDWLTVAGLVSSTPTHSGRIRAWTLVTDVHDDKLATARALGLQGGPELRAAAEAVAVGLQPGCARAATASKPTENDADSDCNRAATASKPTDSSPQGPGTTPFSAALDRQTTRHQTNETDRQGRSSSSSPPGPDGSSSPSGAWVDEWSDEDLMVVNTDSFDTWKSMDAAERRSYLVGEPPPPWWPDFRPSEAKPSSTETIRGVRVVRATDGRIICGRYPPLSGAAFEAALEAAGSERHDDLVQALDEVGGEFAVTSPEGHSQMVAQWVSSGERPRTRPDGPQSPMNTGDNPRDWQALTSLYGGEA